MTLALAGCPKVLQLHQAALDALPGWSVLAATWLSALPGPCASLRTAD